MQVHGSLPLTLPLTLTMVLPMPGRLSIVATPIGCLEDVTLRALRVMAEADVILAEDTRTTKKLCSRHAIATPLRSFHAHTSETKLERIVTELRHGAHYALVSEAGTPLISDPGGRLVATAVDAGVAVESIPGPSAVLAALSIAGLAAHRFCFEGFLPRSASARRKALRRVVTSETTSVVFESPHRIHKLLDELEATLGPERRIALCREMTKAHEQIVRGTPAVVRSALQEPSRGEITVVIEGAGAPGPDEVDLRAAVERWKSEGLSTKDMVSRLQEESGWKRADAYRAVLAAVDDEDVT